MKAEIPEFKGKLVNIRMEKLPGDFAEIKDFAKQKAKEICRDPMLLSWYIGKTGQGYPAFECGSSEKPAWFVFAEARGGDIMIDINEGEYIFIYLSVD
jgi:hypothetical protein